MSKRRKIIALLVPPLIVAGVLAYLNSWKPQVFKTTGANPFQVAFSPDGQFLAVAAHGPAAMHEAGAVDVWRVSSGGFLRAPRLQDRQRLRATRPASLCFIHDGAQLVCTGYGGAGVRVWDSASGRLLTSSPQTSDSAGFAQAWPDKNTVTFSTDDGVGQRTFAPPRAPQPTPKRFPSRHLNAGYGNAMAFAPDGKTSAWSNYDQQQSAFTAMLLRDSATGTARLLPFDNCAGDIVTCEPLAVAFSPDSRTLAVTRARTYYGKPSGIERIAHQTFVWDVATRRVLRSWPDGAVTAFAWSPDGALLAEAREDGTVQLREAATGKLRRVLKAHRHDAASVAFSPDGSLLASCGGDGTLRLWRVK